MAEGGAPVSFGGHTFSTIHLPPVDLGQRLRQLEGDAMDFAMSTALSNATRSRTVPHTPSTTPRGRGTHRDPHRIETYRDLIDTFVTPSSRAAPADTVDLTADDRTPRLLRRTPSPSSTETSGRLPFAPARPAPVGRVRRRGQRRERAAQSGSPVVPVEHADDLKDEGLVTRCKADLDHRFGIDVDDAHRLTAGIKRAKGEVMRDIGLAETRRAEAETREAALKEQVQLLVGRTPSVEEGDDDECREVHDSLTAAVDGLSRAITAYRTSVRAQELTLKEQWTLLQLLRHASGGAATSSAPTCGVCCGQQVAQTAVPCGHSLCHGCMDKMADRERSAWCWFCRTPVADVMDVYFP